MTSFLTKVDHRDRVSAAAVLPTWREIKAQKDPHGTNHCLRLKCIVCSAEQTCRCKQPKTLYNGVCPNCEGQVVTAKPATTIETVQKTVKFLLPTLVQKKLAPPTWTWKPVKKRDEDADPLADEIKSKLGMYYPHLKWSIRKVDGASITVMDLDDGGTIDFAINLMANDVFTMTYTALKPGVIEEETGDEDEAVQGALPDTKPGDGSPVWHQTQGTKKAWVFRINRTGASGGECFQYRIYETAHGMKKELKVDTADDLPAAKKAVIDFFKNPTVASLRGATRFLTIYDDAWDSEILAAEATQRLLPPTAVKFISNIRREISKTGLTSLRLDEASSVKVADPDNVWQLKSGKGGYEPNLQVFHDVKQDLFWMPLKVGADVVKFTGKTGANTYATAPQYYKRRGHGPTSMETEMWLSDIGKAKGEEQKKMIGELLAAIQPQEGSNDRYVRNTLSAMGLIPRAMASFRSKVEAKYAILEKIKEFAKKAVKVTVSGLVALSVFAGTAMGQGMEKKTVDFVKSVKPIYEQINVDFDCQAKDLKGDNYTLNCKWKDKDGKTGARMEILNLGSSLQTANLYIIGSDNNTNAQQTARENFKFWTDKLMKERK